MLGREVSAGGLDFHLAAPFLVVYRQGAQLADRQPQSRKGCPKRCIVSGILGVRKLI